MKTELILKSDVLDIVFENRNKAYGAYNLRKFYDDRLKKSMLAMLLLVAIFSAFAFIPSKKKEKIDVKTIIDIAALPKAEKKQEIKEIKETRTITQPAVSMRKPASNFVITENPKDTIATIDDHITLGDKNIDVPNSGPAVVIPVAPGESGDKGVEPPKPPVDPNVVQETAEVMPSYPGGMEALKKFLQRNLTNPRDLEEGEMISVKMKFVVGYDGKLKGFETLQDGGQEFNKEVLRVLKKMPDWVPGKSNGQNVSVYYTIPVKFVAAD